MFVLIGEKFNLARQPNRPSVLKKTVQDEHVALFHTKRHAERYTKSVTLSVPLYGKNGYVLPFYKSGLLAGFNSYRIQKFNSKPLPINPTPRK